MTEEEIKELQEKVTRLQEESEKLNNDLAVRNGVLADMEKTNTAKEAAIVVLRQSETGLKEHLKKAIAGYRMLATKTNPDIPAEMITGDTIEAIDSAVESAWTLVNKVKERVEKDRSRDHVPVGAPPRTAPDLSAMTPREKIQWGITRTNSR
jgi:hypothetical protein